MSRFGETGVGASAVGIIVNPQAGKDIRRLTSASGQTSDAVKIGIIRRVAAGAIETGIDRLLLSTDSHHLTERAVEGLGGNVHFVDVDLTGSHLDTAAAAKAMWKAHAGALVVLGGDGTCRDVSAGWADAPLIAISTGTNNVFPSSIDGTTAGVAAALVATRSVPVEDVSHQAKRVAVVVNDPGRPTVALEHALVEAALVDTRFVGARAVSDPSAIRWVVACIANPASTGLASIAGRIHPIDRNEPGGVLITLGPAIPGRHGRRVRVPLAPGSFATLDVADVQPLAPSTSVELAGGGVLAYDGERTTPVSRDASISVTIETSGPRVLDVDRVLAIAAAERRFDRAADGAHPPRKDPDGH